MGDGGSPAREVFGARRTCWLVGPYWTCGIPAGGHRPGHRIRPFSGRGGSAEICPDHGVPALRSFVHRTDVTCTGGERHGTLYGYCRVASCDPIATPVERPIEATNSGLSDRESTLVEIDRAARPGTGLRHVLLPGMSARTWAGRTGKVHWSPIRPKRCSMRVGTADCLSTSMLPFPRRSPADEQPNNHDNQ